MAATNISSSLNRQLKIGDVFTPIKWGIFAIEKFKIFQKWINGAAIFDPTMGEGNLLEALVEYGLSNGYTIDKLPIQHLFGNELNTEYYKSALLKFSSKYGINMHNNFTNEDILQLKPHSYDIVFGNPPWQNFVDLPYSYKEQIKHYFFQFDLVGNTQNLLLGGSRIDIAALIIQVSIKNFLKEKGEAIFFMPLSLFLNDGANKNFRTYKVGEINFCVDSIYDFNSENVFENVSTRYGLAHLIRNQKQEFPVSYFRIENNVWKKFFAQPLFQSNDPLSIFSSNEKNEFSKFQPIVLKKESQPRQGVNTCGANHIYFFDSCVNVNEDFVKVSNKINEDILLPKKFIYPLITSKQFQSEDSVPTKWVLLPYNQNGKPMEWQEIQQYTELKEYLESYKHILQNRKGLMLNAILSRGYWWAMLGVGEYCFFPYKIVWESYGKTQFKPKIFEGYWQANQSLQSFIPVKTYTEAKRILSELSNKQIEKYLLSLKMEGTMNWAQPGKIKKIIKYEEETLSLF